ncbi:hypothetical protein [uncultured Desulfobacter sp.]|uniref:hypothetical protein n=1 Tax=uncultured Desulfobacter sp. TaxID=240139 RepID=UPI002AAC1594|nr:hypothetical protein [uncultured Desulfobacter sp.]
MYLKQLVPSSRIWNGEPLIVPLILLILATIVFRITDLDLTITNLFYKDHHFYSKNLQPWVLILQVMYYGQQDLCISPACFWPFFCGLKNFFLNHDASQ